jgi:hypothetical protein
MEAGGDALWKQGKSGQSPACGSGPESAGMRCFELFGLDVLVDEDGRPWLMEVNINPGLHDYGNQWCAEMITSMLQELRVVAIDRVFPPDLANPNIERPSSTRGSWELVWKEK